jgi:lipopolysaccharide transport system ATP-binding protein
MVVKPEMAIKVDKVSKEYTIWSSPSARLHGPLLGQIGQLPFLPSRMRAWCNRLSHESFQDFYALRNVSFEVKKGECVGIIGQNGAGKSTLLQIIAGILEPTTGSVEVRGRITALLELGSGFNPEFTGRENVYLNGSVLGLSADEVKAKLDEIAAFADIGDFLDQPTKTYSSGMVVRLAFAVQSTLNSDILIVDEALAVGDEAFQRKCFSRIHTFQEQGGTILFVSHSAGTVVELCERVILLDRAELLLSGAPKSVVSKYHKLLYAPADKRDSVREEIRTIQGPSVADFKSPGPAATSAAAAASDNDPSLEESYDPGMVPKSTVSYAARGTRILSPHVATTDGRRVNVLVRGKTYTYKYKAEFSQTSFKVRFGMLIKTVSGFELGGGVTHPLGDGLECVEKGRTVQVEFRFRCLLQPGVYFLNAGVLGLAETAEVFLDRHVDVAMFRVQHETDILSTAVVDFCVEPRVTVLDPASTPQSPTLVANSV